MNRILVIDHDRNAMQKLGLACLEQGIGVVMADNVCEGVRALLADSVSLVLVDHLALRLGARESATLFERVAPSVPVVVTGRGRCAEHLVRVVRPVHAYVVDEPRSTGDRAERTVLAGPLGGQRPGAPQPVQERGRGHEQAPVAFGGQLIEQGYGDEDMSNLARAIRTRSGLEG